MRAEFCCVQMIDYTCLGGKMFRGLLVLDATKTLADAKGMRWRPSSVHRTCALRSGLDFSKLKDKAVALGWAIEIVCTLLLQVIACQLAPS